MKNVPATTLTWHRLGRRLALLPFAGKPAPYEKNKGTLIFKMAGYLAVNERYSANLSFTTP